MKVYFTIAVICISIQVVLLAVTRIDVSKEQFVVENGTMRVMCKAHGGKVNFCSFRVRGIKGVIVLNEVSFKTGPIQYWGSGFKNGECGLKLLNVGKKNEGPIECTLGFSDSPARMSGRSKLTLLLPPLAPDLSVFLNGEKKTKHTFKEGDPIKATCKIMSGRPVADIEWKLDDDPLTDGLQPKKTDEYSGLFDAEQTWEQPLSYHYHAKTLKCISKHVALNQLSVNQSIYKFDVEFAPKPESVTEERQLTVGKNGEITFHFMSNPAPTMSWTANGQELPPEKSDSSGNYHSSLKNRGDGHYEGILKIDKVMLGAGHRTFKLKVSNKYGSEEYTIVLPGGEHAASPPSSGGVLSAGVIVGIVASALIISLLLCILLFARATERWCFATGKSRKKSSSEEAIDDGSEKKRPPFDQGKDGVYSSTEYINGNNKSSTEKINTPV